MSRVVRHEQELNQALLDRLSNLSDYIHDYRNGKRQRIKDIAVNLRALVISTKTNKPLLQHVAEIHGIEVVTQRGESPFKDKKRILNLDELLGELAYASNLPTPIRLTNADMIKNYADQEGAHEDSSLSEGFFRAKGKGLLINGVLPYDLVLLGLAIIILNAANPLQDLIAKKKFMMDGLEYY